MGIIIFVLIIWLSFKILEWAFPSSSDSNNDKETSNHDNVAIDSNSNEEPSSYNVGSIDSSNDKETSNHNVGAIDDKPLTIDILPPDLKYNNEVYISFRNKVRKAYESFKKPGYKYCIKWDSDIDGYVIFDSDFPSVGDPIYSVGVHYDDENLIRSKLDDPFFILVSYGIFFDRRDYDEYEEKAEYLNNSEKRKPAIFYTVNTVGNSNLGVYYCNLAVANNKHICEDTEKLGEAGLFEELHLQAKQAYYNGEDVYGDKIKNEKFSFISGSNSDKENYSQILEATDEKPSDLKYNNEVYISFRNIVQKAYESYKKSGYIIAWDSDMDGFLVLEDGSLSDGSSAYAVKVHYDDRNLYKLDDPFYILVTYDIFFDRRDYDDYKEKAEYLNNYLHKELKIPGIYFNVEKIEGSNLGVYHCNFVISNNKILCEETEKLGEAEVFKQTINEARKAHREGEELYRNKISRDEINSSN